MSENEALPSELTYTKEHEWTRMKGGEVEVGITRFAADQLGDVVFVELPEVGTTVTADTPFGVVESVKSVSDLYAPVSGKVTATNAELGDAPELVNESPYGTGWMLRIKPDDATDQGKLLSAEEYDALTKED
ncbi:MAG: glycine cleavage system protein GcvH [Magnetococcales bacterium]|nr:glycine cleavage system protein GcvH [Magnetococcales bacterium]